MWPHGYRLHGNLSPVSDGLVWLFCFLWLIDQGKFFVWRASVNSCATIIQGAFRVSINGRPLDRQTRCGRALAFLFDRVGGSVIFCDSIRGEVSILISGGEAI